MITPIRYYGSKGRLSETIISFMPEHKSYIEVFGGSGAVLFAKEPSKFEVYNDIDENIYTLFSVLRDDTLFPQLEHKLRLTLYSRQDYESATDMLRRQSYNNTVEHAWAVFTCYNLSVNGVGPKRQKSFSKGRGKTPEDLTSRMRVIELIHERLSNVVIENESYEKLLHTYDASDTLFYLDPPYVLSTRGGGKRYGHEMNDDEHMALVIALKNIKGKVMLSGYDNPIYDQLLGLGWGKISIEVTMTVDAGRKGVKRNEVIWCKPKNLVAPKEVNKISYKQLSLLDSAIK